jgi:3-(3-hydroxy-phenyl)propionate hydroxylase
VIVNGVSVRVFTLLHRGRWVLLDFGTPGGLVAGELHENVQHVVGRYDGAWELPALGAVDAPRGILIRPDGYVAWVGQGTSAGLAEAIAAW